MPADNDTTPQAAEPCRSREGGNSECNCPLCSTEPAVSIDDMIRIHLANLFSDLTRRSLLIFDPQSG